MDFIVPVELTLSEVKRAYILHILNHCRGNRMQSAKRLGISLRAIRIYIKNMKAEGIEVPDNHEYYDRGTGARRLNFKYPVY